MPKFPRGLLVFDLDGTLFETQRVTVPAVQESCEAFGLPRPEAARICAFFGQSVASYEAWLAALAGDRSQALIAAANAKELALIETAGRLYPEALEVVQALAAAYTLCICSNGPVAYVDRVVRSHGLAPLLSEYLARGERPVSKTVLLGELLGRHPQRPVAVIGDREDDMAAAKAHGAISIGAAYGFGRAGELTGADVTIAAITALPEALDHFFPEAARQD